MGGYSTGMRQRLGLAAALLGDPQVLVLDEPANGLDPQGIRWLRDLLRGAAAEGRTVLVSSHVLAEVQQTVDDVVVIHRGRLVESGPVAALTTGPGYGCVRLGSRSCSPRWKARGRRSRRAPGDEDALIVHGRTTEQVGDAAFAAGVPVHELAEQTATLEEVFFALTAGGEADRDVSRSFAPSCSSCAPPARSLGYAAAGVLLTLAGSAASASSPATRRPCRTSGAPSPWAAAISAIVLLYGDRRLRRRSTGIARWLRPSWLGRTSIL